MGLATHPGSEGFHFDLSLHYPSHSSDTFITLTSNLLRSGFSNFVLGARYLLFPYLKAEFFSFGQSEHSLAG